MDTTFRQLIAAGDLDQLAAFFTEHGDYGESYELLIDAAVIGHDSVELVNLLLSNGAELAPNVLEAALATQSILEVLLASGVDVNSTNEQVWEIYLIKHSSLIYKFEPDGALNDLKIGQ